MGLLNGDIVGLSRDSRVPDNVLFRSSVDYLFSFVHSCLAVIDHVDEAAKHIYCIQHGRLSPQRDQTHVQIDTVPMLAHCWNSVCDAGLTVCQH